MVEAKQGESFFRYRLRCVVFCLKTNYGGWRTLSPEVTIANPWGCPTLSRFLRKGGPRQDMLTAIS
jgi:hypothetical protein